MQEVQMRVLAVGCHPDDLEIACGGTLSKYASDGHDVFMCHVANGDLGHKEIMPEELARLRDIECKNAGKVLGAQEVFNLNVHDSYVTRYDDKVIDDLTEVIRFTKPHVIITHNDKDYMKDHQEVSALAFDASFMAGLVHRATKSPAFEPIVPIYYMDTLAGVDFLPTHYVDISEHIEAKLAALACHESQIKWMLEHDKIDFLDMVRTCSRYRGYQSGVAYAEGFRICMAYPRMDTKHLLP